MNALAGVVCPREIERREDRSPAVYYATHAAIIMPVSRPGLSVVVLTRAAGSYAQTARRLVGKKKVTRLEVTLGACNSLSELCNYTGRGDSKNTK